MPGTEARAPLVEPQLAARAAGTEMGRREERQAVEGVRAALAPAGTGRAAPLATAALPDRLAPAPMAAGVADR